MALTKKEKKELYEIFEKLETAEMYISNSAGIARKTEYPNGASYQIVNKECSPVHAVDVVNQFIGSDFASFYTAVNRLHRFINNVK